MNRLTGDYSTYGFNDQKSVGETNKTQMTPIEEKANSSASVLKNIPEIKPTTFLKSKKIGSWLVNQIFGSRAERAGNPRLRDKVLEPYPHESISFATEDGLELKGTIVKPRGGIEPSGKTYIYCSGSFGCYEQYVQTFGFSRGILRELTNQGHQVMLFDYRGFGENMHLGDPSAEGVKKDAEAAYKCMRDRGAEDNDIVMYGYSLGGTVAASVASQHPTDLILDRVPTNLATAAKDAVPLFFKTVAHIIIGRKFPLSTIKPLEEFKGKQLKIVLEQEKDDPRVGEFGKTLEGLGRKSEDCLFVSANTPHIFDEHDPPSINFLSKIYFT